MKISITGGTGFVGCTLAAELASGGHEVILVARGKRGLESSVRLQPGVTLVHASVTDERRLHDAFSGCNAVVHLAGIDREEGNQTFEAVHVSGTRNAVAAARAQGVRRFVMLSPLRARRGTGSELYESKAAAEEIVRESGLRYTIVKPGAIYGRGDQLLNNLSYALRTFPVFSLVGYRRCTVRPVAIADVVAILAAAATCGHLRNASLPAVGPDSIHLSDVVRLVAAAVDRRPWFIRLPIMPGRSKSTLLEEIMKIPGGTRQFPSDIGVVEAASWAEPLPGNLVPRTHFTIDSIRAGLSDLTLTGVRRRAYDAA